MSDQHERPQGNLQQAFIDYKLEAIMESLRDLKTSQANNYAEIKATLEKHYVTQSDFIPIQKIVYGLVGLILTSFVIAIMALVLKK